MNSRPLDTEPQAVATGCGHSTYALTCLLHRLSLASGRYRSRFCKFCRPFDGLFDLIKTAYLFRGSILRSAQNTIHESTRNDTKNLESHFKGVPLVLDSTQASGLRPG